MFCCIAKVLNKTKNIPHAPLFCLFCSWVLVGAMAWPCSSWTSMGRLSPQEADKCLLASCCLWSSQPLSCSSESEVIKEPDWRLDFIIPCSLTDFKQTQIDIKNEIKLCIFEQGLIFFLNPIWSGSYLFAEVTGYDLSQLRIPSMNILVFIPRGKWSLAISEDADHVGTSGLSPIIQSVSAQCCLDHNINLSQILNWHCKQLFT